MLWGVGMQVFFSSSRSESDAQNLASRRIVGKGVLWEGAAELLLWKLRRWIEGAVDPGRIPNWPICVGQEVLGDVAEETSFL